MLRILHKRGFLGLYDEILTEPARKQLLDGWQTGCFFGMWLWSLCRLMRLLAVLTHGWGGQPMSFTQWQICS